MWSYRWVENLWCRKSLRMLDVSSIQSKFSNGLTCSPLEPMARGSVPPPPPHYAWCICIACGDNHANNITHTQHSPTCCFLCIQRSRGLHYQQFRENVPIASLHRVKFSVLTYFFNESIIFFKVSTFNSNTFLSSTMSLTKWYWTSSFFVLEW